MALPLLHGFRAARTPIVVLWLLFCASLYVTGSRRFRYQQDVYGLMLMVCGFSGHILNESIFRDHMLQLFLFLFLFLFVAGALLSEMFAMANQKTEQPCPCHNHV